MAYDAFISYRHGADARLALALQTALGRLARPWFKRRALRVFRDETDLVASPGLWSSIQQALEQSGYFVLLASPEAAQSTWVQRELDHWLRSGKGQRLLLVLCEGEIVWNPHADDFDWSRTTALPTVLRGAFDEEPLWVDLRWAAAPDADLTLANPAFKTAAATIAAPLHGRSKDQLVGEDLIQHRRTRLVAAAAAVVLLLLVGLSWFFWLGKGNERSAKEQEALRKSVALLSAASLDETDGDRALLLAVEAARRQQQSGLPQLLEVDDALRQALASRPPREASMLHPVAVRQMAFSPDGERLATADAAGQVRIWQAEGRQLVGVEHRRAVTALSWSADGKWLASADEGGTASVWLADSGSERMRYEADDGARIYDVELSPDGAFLATASGDQTVRVFDIASRQEVARLEHSLPVFQVDFLPARRGGDPTEWLMTRAAVKLHFWNWRQSREEFSMSSDNPAVQDVVAEVDPSGEVLALATQVSAGQETVLIDLRQGPVIGRIKDDSTSSGQEVEWQLSSSMTAARISWGPRGRLLAAAGRVDGHAVVIDRDRLGSGRDPQLAKVRSSEGIRGVELLTSALLATRTSHAANLWDIATDRQQTEIRVAPVIDEILGKPGGDRLAVRSGNEVSVWQVEGYNSQFEVQDRAPWLDLWSVDGRYLLGQEGADTVVLREIAGGAVAARLPAGGKLYQSSDSTAFSPGGRWLAAAVEDAVAIFDMSQGRLAGRLAVAGATRLAWSGSDRLAVATSSGLSMWEAATSGQVFTARFESSPEALAASPDGQRLAAVWPERIEVFDSAEGVQLGAVPLSSAAGPLVWSPTGTRLAIGDGANICLWDGAGANCSQVLSHSAAVTALAFSPDNGHLFAGDKGGSLIQWHLKDGTELARSRLVGKVQTLDFSADGEYLATAAGGQLESLGLAQIWRADGLVKVAEMEHPRGVVTAGFSADDRWLATRTAEPKLRVWAWRPADLAGEACQRLTRNLSAEEWRDYFGPRAAGPGEPYRETCPGLDAELADRIAAPAVGSLSGRPAAGAAIRAVLFEESGRRPGRPIPDPRDQPSPIRSEQPPAEPPEPAPDAASTQQPAEPIAEPDDSKPPEQEPTSSVEKVDLVRLSAELERLSERIIDQYEDFLDDEDHDTDGDEEDIEDLFDDLADAAEELAGVARRARGDGGGLGSMLRGKKRAQQRAEENLDKKRREVLRYGKRLRPLIARYPIGSAGQSSWQRIDRLLRQLEAARG